MIGPTVLSIVLAAAAPLFTYRFDEVKSAVYRSPASNEKLEQRVTAGDPGAPGDLVRTGWLGRAVISVPERASRFEISSGTRVKLARGDPGILLVVEKGKVKAFFDALTGEDPIERRIAPPGAQLAVRGTRYGVEVDDSGLAALAVFEGTVEVVSTAPGIAPLSVVKGECCAFGPGVAPRSAPMGPMGIHEGNWGSRPPGAGQGPGGQTHPGSPGPGPAGGPAGPGGAGGMGSPGAAPPASQPRGGKGR